VREPAEFARWTPSFSWEDELRAFRRTFASYISTWNRSEIQKEELVIKLGALEQEERERRYGREDEDDLDDIPGHDLRLFASFDDYCNTESSEHGSLKYILTKETFRASQDPVQSVKKPGAWTHLRSLFGDRNHYEVDEYCMRIDLFLTKRARLTRIPSLVSIPAPPHHTRVMEEPVVSSASTTLQTPVGSPAWAKKKKEATNAGSSEGDAIIVTSSDSDGTSQGPLETHYAKERIEEESSSPKAVVRSSSTSASLKSRHERENSTSEKKEKDKRRKKSVKDKRKK